MGRKFDEVHEEEHRVPYKIVKVSEMATRTFRWKSPASARLFSPPEISAIDFSKLKSRREAKPRRENYAGGITVPAYFQRFATNATKDAGKIAGLEVLANHQRAHRASLAYGLDKKKDEKIAVYDLGGGTFDILFSTIGDGVFEVKATNGDTHLR